MLLNKKPQMGRIVSILAGLACLALPLWAKGYLTVIGPSPIRLQAPPAPAPPPVVPPPLPPPETNASETEAHPDNDQPPMATAAPILFEPIIVQAGGDTNFVSSILGQLGSPPDQEWLTPQMLVPYYRELGSGTNGTGKVVIVPPTFVPPAPMSRPSSKALYTVPAK